MERIVIEHRTMSRVLAVLPALGVVLAVRALTLGHPDLLVRLAAAGGVALACWLGFRLLTTRLTVGETGVEVRGVLYDAEIPWSDLAGVDVGPAAPPLRALVWGVMQPHTVTLRGTTRTLSPIAAISGPDDAELARAIGAMRVRIGAWRPPTQRQTPPQELESGAGVGAG